MICVAERCLTEDQFSKLIEGVGLTSSEIAALRKLYNLPYNGELLSPGNNHLIIAQQKLLKNPFLH